MGIVEKDATKLASALPGMENWITVPAETHCGCLNKPGGDTRELMDSKAFSQNGN